MVNMIVYGISAGLSTYFNIMNASLFVTLAIFSLITVVSINIVDNKNWKYGLTLALATMLGIISSTMFSAVPLESILSYVVLTFLLFLGLSYYAVKTKNDFTN
jgi:FtsH-binding integral membrane protein